MTVERLACLLPFSPRMFFFNLSSTTSKQELQLRLITKTHSTPWRAPPESTTSTDLQRSDDFFRGRSVEESFSFEVLLTLGHKEVTPICYSLSSNIISLSFTSFSPKCMVVMFPLLMLFFSFDAFTDVPKQGRSTGCGSLPSGTFASEFDSSCWWSDGCVGG